MREEKDKQINLVGTNEELGRLLSVQKKARQASYGAIFVYVFLVVIMVLVNFFFFQAKKAEEEENARLKTEVEALRDKEGMLVTIKDRIALAKGVFTASGAFPIELIDDIFALVPREVSLTALNAKSDKVVLQASSSTSLSLGNFLAAVKQQNFTSAILNNISWGAKSGYSFSLDIK